MPSKMLNPNTTLVVVPASDVANPLSPTADELNGAPAINISCAVTRGYTLNPTDSDTDDTASICDTGNVQTRLFDNYEGELTMFRDANIADNTSVYNAAFQYFRDPDKDFYVYRRLGKKSTVAFADGDIVEGFYFANDRMRSVDGGDSGPIQFTVPLLSQGNYTGYTFVGVVAPPTVTDLNPAIAPLAGGSTHTVTGTYFGSAYEVTVGAQAVPATVVDNTTLRFIAPAHASGTVHVRVRNAAGQSATSVDSEITYSA